MQTLTTASAPASGRKLTLTTTEHRRIDAVMGTAAPSADGTRLCRCGEHVRWTPDDLWRHALACEKQQARAAKTSAVQGARERELLAAATPVEVA